MGSILVSVLVSLEGKASFFSFLFGQIMEKFFFRKFKRVERMGREGGDGCCWYS